MGRLTKLISSTAGRLIVRFVLLLVLILVYQFGRLFWLSSTEGPLVYAPVAYGDAVLFMDDEHRICAVDRQTGKLRWTLDEGGWSSDTAPKVHDGFVYSIIGDNLCAIDVATGEKSELFEVVRDAISLPMPVVSDGAVYLAGENHVYSFDRQTGKMRWAFNFTGRDVQVDGARKGFKVVDEPISAVYADGVLSTLGAVAAITMYSIKRPGKEFGRLKQVAAKQFHRLSWMALYTVEACLEIPLRVDEAGPCRQLISKAEKRNGDLSQMEAYPKA